MTVNQRKKIEKEKCNPFYDLYYQTRGIIFKRQDVKRYDVEIIYGEQSFTIEEKTRDDKYLADFAPEERQNKAGDGWAFYCNADWILYGYYDSKYLIHTVYCVTWKGAVQTWYHDNKQLYKMIKSPPSEGYGSSLICPIPWDHIPEGWARKIYPFGGDDVQEIQGSLSLQGTGDSKG